MKIFNKYPVILTMDKTFKPPIIQPGLIIYLPADAILIDMDNYIPPKNAK